ncbi:MAG: sulfatase-like hydrolase/transferase [Luteolibacter sp.]
MIKKPLLWLLFACLPCPAPAEIEKPNIIVFIVDDLGVMDTSLPFLTDTSGKPQRFPLNDFYRTPQMERLAALGIRFNNFCAMSVCSPSRATLLTGQNAARHRTTNWINPNKDNAGSQGPPLWNWQGLKKGDVTLPGIMRGHGYRTIHVGKGHFGPLGSQGADPAILGFDINVAGSAQGHPGSYYGTEHYGALKKGHASGVPHLEKYHGTDTFLTEALTREANARIGDAVKDGKPFFLHFSHYAVHSPFDSDSRFASNYVNSGKSAKAQAFATLVEGIDKSLGDVLDHLKTLGIAENTCVFFLGDNGSDAPLGQPHEAASSAPLRGMKATHYEGGMRVPLIAAWAQPDPAHPLQKRLPVFPGAIQNQQAAIQDLFPTILNLAGIKPPAATIVDGIALDALLTGKSDPTRKEQFLMHYPHAPHRSDYWTSWRDGEWKVIYHYLPSTTSNNSHYQLYHLREDPYEETDLAVSKPTDLDRMMRGLVEALEKHEALYPVESDGVTPLKPKLPGS